jgi:hypothetical protein
MTEAHTSHEIFLRQSVALLLAIWAEQPVRHLEFHGPYPIPLIFSQWRVRSSSAHQFRTLANIPRLEEFTAKELELFTVIDMRLVHAPTFRKFSPNSASFLSVIVGLTRPLSNRLWSSGGWIEHSSVMLAVRNKARPRTTRKKRVVGFRTEPWLTFSMDNRDSQGNYEYIAWSGMRIMVSANYEQIEHQQDTCEAMKKPTISRSFNFLTLISMLRAVLMNFFGLYRGKWRCHNGSSFWEWSRNCEDDSRAI